MFTYFDPSFFSLQRKSKSFLGIFPHNIGLILLGNLSNDIVEVTTCFVVVIFREEESVYMNVFILTLLSEL